MIFGLRFLDVTVIGKIISRYGKLKIWRLKMDITYLGHSCFKITGERLTVLCDPFNPEKLGIPLLPQKADVVLITHPHADHNWKDIVRGDFDLLDEPGECEIDGSEFLGIPSYHDDKKGAERGYNTIFRFDIDGITLCHMGDVGTSLSDEQLRKLANIDILMIPIGGFYTIDPKTAIEIISQLKPRVILPMHYRDNQNLADIDHMYSLADFLVEMGIDNNPKLQDELIISKDNLPEGPEVIVLSY